MEYERLTSMLDDNRAELQQCKLEAEMLRQKQDVTRTEYHCLQRDSAARIAELETQLADARDRLRAYESVEAELDSAIAQAGVGTSSWDFIPSPICLFSLSCSVMQCSYQYCCTAEASDEQMRLRELVSAVPTTLRRRIQHSVNLAKDVVRLQRESAMLKSEKQALDEQLRTATTQVCART